MHPVIKIKRVYEKPSAEDGVRVLVDRIWPRGIRREEAAWDEWARYLAPSPLLRKWFGHDPALWEEFGKRYRAELKNNSQVADFLQRYKNAPTLTLLFAARDTGHTHALILKQYLGRLI